MANNLEQPCKLCGIENTDKHRDSHIFSKFFFLNIHRNNERSPDPPLVVGVDENNACEIMQEGNEDYKGEVEQYIYCITCEKKLSNREGYGAQLYNNQQKNKITRSPLIKGKHPSWIDYYHYEKFNYQKFKLFILSLFWRVSTSNLPGFEHFKLGVEHDKKIAEMIKKGNPEGRMEYPITQTFILRPPGIRRDRLYYPRTREPEVHTFFFSDKFNAGVAVNLYTDINGKEDFLKEWAFHTNGTLDCHVLSEPQTISFYTGFLQMEMKEFIPDLPPNVNLEGFTFRDAYPPPHLRAGGAS